MKKLLTAMMGVFFLGLGLAVADKEAGTETTQTTHTLTMSGVT